MVIVRLAGGLGNQMFQYAAALALAEHHRTALKLDCAYFEKSETGLAHNRYSLHCFNIIEQFATANEIKRMDRSQFTFVGRTTLAFTQAMNLNRIFHRLDRTKRASQSKRRHAQLLRKLFLTPTHCYHRQPVVRYYPEFQRLGNEVYLEGLFQSEHFFSSISEQLRLHFTFRYPAPSKVCDMARQIANEAPSVAVHFRRGDYVSNKMYAEMCGALSLDYYYRAIRHLRTIIPDVILYVFSDDIDAIEREFRPDCRCVFVRVASPGHAYDEIRLMSLCQHQIIANSTFAWWSAWLNPSSSKIVIAPTPWFADDTYQDADLIPSKWVCFPR